jgi:hypothetical protein
MRLADMTKERLRVSIEEDQGTSYRAHLKVILPKMEDAYQESSDGYRRHLGASLIGRDCAFSLWLGFRWAKVSRFKERILRLFNRGHLEEAHFLAMLESAKIPIWYETPEGGQFKFSDIQGHFGSSLDGVVKIPELLGKPAYAEFKTHNDKSFNKLVKEGVRDSKFEHFVQMQICMNAHNLKYGVYFAVNKNDDTLHIEIIEVDKVTVKNYLTRAKGVIYAKDGLPRISNKSSWWQCKFCDHLDICHNKAKPEINCRTCVYAEAVNGGWHCTNSGFSKSSGHTLLDKDFMKRGCVMHTYNPSLLSSVNLVSRKADEYVELELEDGKIIKHGMSHVTSKDLEL